MINPDRPPLTPEQAAWRYFLRCGCWPGDVMSGRVAWDGGEKIDRVAQRHEADRLALAGLDKKNGRAIQ